MYEFKTGDKIVILKHFCSGAGVRIGEVLTIDLITDLIYKTNKGWHLFKEVGNVEFILYNQEIHGNIMDIGGHEQLVDFSKTQCPIVPKEDLPHWYDICNELWDKYIYD